MLMPQQPQILNLDDIKLLVDTFYERIREHEMLAPVFNERIQDKWPEHLDKMYRFWQTVLLGDHTYFGSPFPPHAKLPVDETHFNQWLIYLQKLSMPCLREIKLTKPNGGLIKWPKCFNIK